MTAQAAACVMLAGGGTGGHLFPGVAVARELRRRHARTRVVFVGVGRPLETRVLAAEGLPLERIRAAALVGRSLPGVLRGLGALLLGVLDAVQLLRRYRPRLVVGLGGYSSAAVILVALLRGVPTLLLEQNAVPGMTNRVFGRLVRGASLAYAEALPYFGGRGFVTGNPVRAGFFDAPPARTVLDEVRVLVLGGSQGARALNAAMAEAAPRLAASGRSVRVMHQSGAADVESVQAAYRAANVTAQVTPFVDAIEQAVATADIVVCRAGALTLAELAAAGRPAILVPYPHAANDHQRSNAAVVARAGAVEVIDPDELGGEVLAVRLLALIGDDRRRLAMADASRRLGRPAAAASIVDRMDAWGRW